MLTDNIWLRKLKEVLPQSLYSFLIVIFAEFFCFKLTVTFKVQYNIKYCFVLITLGYLLQREKYMKRNIK